MKTNQTISTMTKNQRRSNEEIKSELDMNLRWSDRLAVFITDVFWQPHLFIQLLYLLRVLDHLEPRSAARVKTH